MSWRLRSPHKDMEEYTKHFLAALEDHNVFERFRLFMTPSIVESLDPVKASLQNAVKDLQHNVATTQDALCRRDEDILSLCQEVSELRAHPGSTDERLLDICNNVMNLNPPLCPEEVKVSHRVRQIERSQSEDGETAIVAKPRPIIIKFVCRRTKALAARKDLHKLNPHNPTHDILQAAALEADADDNVVDKLRWWSWWWPVAWGHQEVATLLPVP